VGDTPRCSPAATRCCPVLCVFGMLCVCVCDTYMCVGGGSTLVRAQHADVTVRVTLQLVKPGVGVSCMVASQVVGGITTFFLVKAQAETAVFNIDVGELESQSLWGTLLVLFAVRVCAWVHVSLCRCVLRSFVAVCVFF